MTAPGRVNLIGEHIDYCGLPVLPMAVDRATCLACAPSSRPVVEVTNSSRHFPRRVFSLHPHIEPFGTGDWGNYLKAAAQELVHRYSIGCGIAGAVSSNLPIAAGLSSSSSLLVAAALALADANGLHITRPDLAALLQHAEQYVGTKGGGMDQAVSLEGRKDHALLIEFEPELTVTPVPVPNRLEFIVAVSRVRAEKSGAVRDAYNERVRDCRRALDIVRRYLGLGHIPNYVHLVHEYSPSELLECAARALNGRLERRFRHVVSEAERVGETVAALRESRLERFGELLIRSHHSLRDDYEVSTPELDDMVEIALAAGALGARLTGAGFGGSAIIACESGQTGHIMNSLAERCYQGKLSDGDGMSFLFRARASDGARVHQL